MISLILALVFIGIFIFFAIAGGNYVLKSMIDNVLGKNEHFENIDDSIVNRTDACKKIDERVYNNLNFQTGTNIPLSPINYKDYVGEIYIDNNKQTKNELDKGMYCLDKSKLLYDGIWDSDMVKDSPYEIQKWNLTNGNLTDGYYCSDKLIQVNKPMPEDYIDKSAVPPPKPSNIITYFNDSADDIFDTEIACFPSVFNAGITEDLKKAFI